MVFNLKEKKSDLTIFSGLDQLAKNSDKKWEDLSKEIT